MSLPAQVIIEASGIADPAAIAHHALTPGFDLDGVVVLLDAETVRRRERHPVVGRTIRRQLAAADVLVVNKIDLVSDGELADLDRWLADAAPAVPVIHARGGEVPVAALVGFGHGETLPVTEMGHAGDYVSLSITLDRPVVRERLEAFSTAFRQVCSGSKESCASSRRPANEPSCTELRAGGPSPPKDTGGQENRADW